MKCLSCGFIVELDFEIVEEYKDFWDKEYPEEHCYNCSTGIMVPLNLYNELKTKK
jgi:hypothetical protein